MTLSESITKSLSEAKEPFKVGDFALVKEGTPRLKVAKVGKVPKIFKVISVDRSDDNKRWEITVSHGRSTKVLPSSKLQKAPDYYKSPEFIKILGKAGFYDKFRRNINTVRMYRDRYLSPEDFNTELSKIKDGKKMFALFKRAVRSGTPPSPAHWSTADLYFDAVK